MSMKVSSIVRFKTNLDTPEKEMGIVISTNFKLKMCDMLFCGDIITCDWEDLEVLSESR